jgi:competence protein ComEA
VGAAGRAGRGERGRVAARVRAVVGADEPGADVEDEPFAEPVPAVAARVSTDRFSLADPLPLGDWIGTERTRHRTPGLLARLAHRIPGAQLGGSGARGALAVGLVVLLAGVVTLVWVLSARPRAVPAAPAIETPAASGPTSTGATSTRTSTQSALVVDVTGKVHRPGLYRLPLGSRVDDAVRAAGGALPGVSLATVNLAAKVADGQQIPIGTPGAASGGGGAGAGSSGSAAGPVSLNSATLEQLQTLPGVGPVLAQNIIDWRDAHGSFGTVDQLNDVPGIGDTKFAALRPLVSP